jgi:hypothetical protein
MDGPSLIVVGMPLVILVALFAGIGLPFSAGRRPRRTHALGRPTPIDGLKRIRAATRNARPPGPGASAAAPVEYLYVPCARIRYHGHPPQTRRWVQEVPIVKKTAKWIYYTSDTWDRNEAVVSPGRISREDFETDTRRHDDRPGDAAAGLVGAPHGRGHQHRVHFPAPSPHGYPAGVIPIPGDPHRPGPAGRLFFATRQAAADHLYRRERERAEQAAPQAPPMKELRRAMADAHPDRGGTAEQFIQARRRYQAALRASARTPTRDVPGCDRPPGGGL